MVKPGILVSAGKNKANAYNDLTMKIKPAKEWRDGYQYAYFDQSFGYVVAWCHHHNLAVQLLGEFELDPSDYVMGNIDIHMKEGNGRFVDIFYNTEGDEEVKAFFDMLLTEKTDQLPTLRSTYASADDILNALKKGQQLKGLKWMDDGMKYIGEFTEKFYARPRS